MAKFKVGDRVRKVGGVTNGSTGTYDGPCDFQRRSAWVNWDESGSRLWVYDDDLALVQPPLKLEKGATVRLKDGVDEWEVLYVSSSGRGVDIRRGEDAVYCVSSARLVVVKEKPEDPKPDYYV